MKFKIKLTRTETHSYTTDIHADSPAAAMALMEEMETDGEFDTGDTINDWKYEYGQTDMVEEVSS